MLRLLRIWAYHFHRAFSGMLQNRLIHAISVGTITISLLFLGGFALFFVNAGNWVVEWGKSVSMSVYLDDEIDPSTRKAVETAIRSLPDAQIRDYVSKEKAFSILQATLGSQAGLLDGLTKNPLPASFEIIFKDSQKDRLDPRRIKGELEKVKGVSEVQYSEEYQERFEGVIRALKITGLILGLLLCMAVLLIVTNTIKLTIYSRREEIEIYKLVGASDWFVRAPLLIEGAAQGLLGGSMALIILFALHLVFSLDKVQVLGLPIFQVVFLPFDYGVALLFLGLTLGLIGSFIAIGRFFRI
jgi:cell division transport system permease protein